MVLNNTEETDASCSTEKDDRRHDSEYHYTSERDPAYGMKRYTESHENYRANLSDGMDCKRYAEIPMSAF